MQALCSNRGSKTTTRAARLGKQNFLCSTCFLYFFAPAAFCTFLLHLLFVLLNLFAVMAGLYLHIKQIQNLTNVQLCSSQVDKGKSDRFSEKFVCVKKILCENLLGEHSLSEHFFFLVKFFG